MNKLKNILSLLLLFSLVFAVGTGPVFAQEESAPKKESKQEKESKSKPDSKSDKPQEKDESLEGEDEAKGKQEKEKKPDEDDSDSKEESDDDQDESDDEEKAKESVEEKVSNVSRSNLPTTYSKKSETFVKVFDSVVSSVNDSTLQIMAGKRQIALGTVVDSNGFILTKASELRGELGCKLGNGKIVKAVVHGIDTKTDLALLKIEAENLSEAPWSDETAPQIGQWLASPMADKSEPIIGVVSVDVREILGSKAFVGIQMDDIADEDGVVVTLVVPRSPAAYADLKKDDIILKIDKVEITDVAKLRGTLAQYDVNDRIALAIKRDGKNKKINLTLADRDKISPENQRSNTQNNMGSTLSQRRKAFPLAFQHDSGLNNNTCGGPIVDLSGKIVGVNIARAGRVSSLALPVESVRPIIEMLKTGEFAPAIVNKEAIVKIDAELEELALRSKTLPAKKAVLDNRYQREKGRVEELERSVKELQERLKSVKDVAGKKKKELDSIRRELFNAEKVRQRLQSDRKQLATGSR